MANGEYLFSFHPTNATSRFIDPSESDGPLKRCQNERYYSSSWKTNFLLQKQRLVTLGKEDCKFVGRKKMCQEKEKDIFQ